MQAKRDQYAMPGTYSYFGLFKKQDFGFLMRQFSSQVWEDLKKQGDEIESKLNELEGLPPRSESKIQICDQCADK